MQFTIEEQVVKYFGEIYKIFDTPNTEISFQYLFDLFYQKRNHLYGLNIYIDDSFTRRSYEIEIINNGESFLKAFDFKKKREFDKIPELHPFIFEVWIGLVLVIRLINQQSNIFFQKYIKSEENIQLLSQKIRKKIRENYYQFLLEEDLKMNLNAVVEIESELSADMIT